MVSRAVTVSLLTRLAVPKHQEELPDVHFQEEVQDIMDLGEIANSLMELELDMRQEFNRLPEPPDPFVGQEFSRRLELLDLTMDPEDLGIMEVVDSMPGSTAILLDIAQVVLHIPTTTLKIKI